MSENRDRRPPMRRDVLAPEIDPPADIVKPSAGAKVSVACKLPHGLIMRLFMETTRSEPVMGGGMRDVKVWEPTGASVVVRGNRAPYGVAPTWLITSEGFGVTTNVDKDFWEAWLAQNKTLPAVVHGLIWALESPDEVQKESKKLANLKSGLEPLDPENLPRGLGARTPGGGIVHPITTDTGVKSL